MGDKGNLRAKWHDYKGKGLYHITLLKSDSVPPFATLAGDCAIPVGQPGSCHVIASPLGKIIKEALRELPNMHPALKLYQYALMPDHLHVLLRVEYDMDEILGRKIGLFKDMVNKKAGTTGVFEAGFNDQILNSERNLDAVFRYLRANPYRLAVRKAMPEYFTRRNRMMVGGVECQIYGNAHLLDNPFKEQVIVHRADSDEEFAGNKERWLYNAANGGVLVSPFISKREREVRAEADTLGGRFILLTNEPMREREKPSGHDFDLCSEGRLLIIAPIESMPFSRAACLKMNALAAAIASPPQ